MGSLRIPSRISLLAGIIALVAQVSIVGADGGDQGGRAEVTFTKWVLNGGAGPFMSGVARGDVEGAFIGELFANVSSTNPGQPIVSRIEVVYGVRADDPSLTFTALIRGGASLGKAQFDGRVLAGWRTGAAVHVEWVRFPSPSADCPSPPATAGAFCFVGTMTIERAGNGNE
jgi:hypothetical protein